MDDDTDDDDISGDPLRVDQGAHPRSVLHPTPPGTASFGAAVHPPWRREFTARTRRLPRHRGNSGRVSTRPFFELRNGRFENLVDRSRGDDSFQRGGHLLAGYEGITPLPTAFSLRSKATPTRSSSPRVRPAIRARDSWPDWGAQSNATRAPSAANKMDAPCTAIRRATLRRSSIASPGLDPTWVALRSRITARRVPGASS